MNHVTDELNRTTLTNIDARESFRVRDGPDRQKDKKWTEEKTGAGITGTETIETTRESETEIQNFIVAETTTEIEAATMPATETGCTR